MSDEKRRKPRLPRERLRETFADIRPPLGDEEALEEAQRCYYCEYDVPCMRGCPAFVDVPRFIKAIAEGQPEEAGRVILETNVLGGVCGRVCPVEKLCEERCICDTLHGRPIPIAKLQRYATDRLLAAGHMPFERARRSGRRVAVVGAGPAGLAAAFELARHGHDVVLYDKDEEPGGLDRYGLAEYKVDADYIRDEIRYLLTLGGIELRCGVDPIDATGLAGLRASHDAVVLALGMGAGRRLGIPGEDLTGVDDALDFIRRIKAGPLDTVEVGSDVVVIGAGNTAVDVATQARRLGAPRVTIAYRRDRSRAKCTDHEFDLAVADGCEWRWHLQPAEILGQDGEITAVRFQHTDQDDEVYEELPCDHLIVAVGQTPQPWLRDVDGLTLAPNGTLVVDPITWMTELPGLFACGDCVKRAKEVVNAAHEGRLAALGVDGYLRHGLLP